MVFLLVIYCFILVTELKNRWFLVNLMDHSKKTENYVGEHAIKLHDLFLSFINSNKREPLPVLRNISICIKPGEIITVVGPSGCGKTSLLKAIGGLFTSKQNNVQLTGSVHVFNMSAQEAKKRGVFAFAFQNPVLLPWRTVKQNIELPLEVLRKKSKNSDNDVAEMLSLMEISEFSLSYPHQLSGGMQQRVNLARALIQNPNILLMDEPFGSLDQVSRERLNFELLKIHGIKRPTIIFVTHNLTEAVLLGDRVIILSNRPSMIKEEVLISFNKARSEETLLSKEFMEFLHKVKKGFLAGEMQK